MKNDNETDQFELGFAAGYNAGLEQGTEDGYELGYKQATDDAETTRIIRAFASGQVSANDFDAFWYDK